MIVPLEAAQELYKLKQRIEDSLLAGVGLCMLRREASAEAKFQALLTEIRSIDLKYPTNENGIVVKVPENSKAFNDMWREL